MCNAEKYEDLMSRLATGWNTWHTYNALSHVLLPEGLSLNIGIKDAKSGYQRTMMQFEPYDWQENESARPSLHT